MLAVSPSALYLISASVALAVGQYTVLTTYLGADFVKRYKALQKAFAKWQDTETIAMVKGVLLKRGEKASQDRIVKFVRDWVGKNTAVMSLDITYWNLDKLSKAIISAASLAAVLSIGDLVMPDFVISTFQGRPVTLFDLSLALFSLAVLGILYYVLKLHGLTSIITRYELGMPVEDVVKLLQGSSTQ